MVPGDSLLSGTAGVGVGSTHAVDPHRTCGAATDSIGTTGHSERLGSCVCSKESGRQPEHLRLD